MLIMSQVKNGKLFLLPVSLGDHGEVVIPEYAIRQMHQLDYFIMERAKTGRRFLRTTGIPRPISELTIFELDKHNPTEGINEMLAPLKEGKDIGLMSEAGCPAVADPGSLFVKKAHEMGVQVVPMVGPSSILLALMASGLNGQQFRFCGYLSPKTPQLNNELRQLEQMAQKRKETQIFIETPYRNRKVLESALQILSANTKLCVAVDLSLPTEWIKTAPVKQWKTMELPDLHKRPAIFLIG